MTTSKKTCFKCQKEKALSEFYAHSAMADGRLNKCKECTRADARQHRRSDKYREQVLAYDRSRGNRQTKEYQKMHKQKHPVETKAREKLSNAVRDKKIERPNRCQHCGKDTRLHGHHHDYSKPLSVIWLCVPCHRQIHAFMDLINKANKEHEQKAS